MPVNAGAVVGSTCSARSAHDVSKTDVGKYLAALRRAQMEIDLHPELYRHHHLRAVPEKYREQVDVRTFGTGERIVFLPTPGKSSRPPGTGPRPPRSSPTCPGALLATTRPPWSNAPGQGRGGQPGRGTKRFSLPVSSRSSAGTSVTFTWG